MLLGILGEAGTGKDEVARILVQEGRSYVIAFADPIKIYCQWMFDWPAETLWGASAHRAELDERFKFLKCPKCGRTEGIRDPEGIDPGKAQWRVCALCRAATPLEKLMVPLSPRYTLQHLGDWARRFRPDAYVAFALTRVTRVMQYGTPLADPLAMVLPPVVMEQRWRQHARDNSPRHVVINDVRMKSEIDGIHRTGGRVYRVKRAHTMAGLTPGIPNHPSEMEQRTVTDDAIDGVIDNHGTLEDLHREARSLLHHIEH
jgi:hypothetical protein